MAAHLITFPTREGKEQNEVPILCGESNQSRAGFGDLMDRARTWGGEWPI